MYRYTKYKTIHVNYSLFSFTKPYLATEKAMAMCSIRSTASLFRHSACERPWWQSSHEETEEIYIPINRSKLLGSAMSKQLPIYNSSTECGEKTKCLICNNV